jgi:nucleoside 2-deoxyribosyltransferase
MSKPKLYLASPFFNDKELRYYRRAVEKLRLSGYEVFVPQEHEIEGAWEMSNEEWAEKVYIMDEKAIWNCDVVIVLNFGLYSDSGTAWEAGYARAHGKKVVQVLCGGDNAVYSLMMLSSADRVVNFEQLQVWQRVSADMSKIVQK